MVSGQEGDLRGLDGSVPDLGRLTLGLLSAFPSQKLLGRKIHAHDTPHAVHGAPFAQHAHERIDARRQLERQRSQRWRGGTGQHNRRARGQLIEEVDQLAGRMAEDGAARIGEDDGREAQSVCDEEEDDVGAAAGLGASVQVREQGIEF